MQHAHATARFAIYYGADRDTYDVRGRTAHESLFNAANGTYRGPSTQQGYSPFSTWTRGLAWAMTGFAEQLEFLATRGDDELSPYGGRAEIESWMLDAARATCDFYIDHGTAADGIPYWDTGAPGLNQLDGWADRPADPFNEHEPVDSSAAAIAAQGLLRLSRVLAHRGARRRPLRAGGPPCPGYLADRGRTVSLDRRRPSRPAAAFDLPPAERLGPRAGRLPHTARRIQSVGRLSPARSGAARAPHRTRAAVPDLFRARQGLKTLAPQGKMNTRTALVTGGTRGIGLGIARALASDGWNLALCGVRSADDVAPVLATFSGRADYFRADVSSPADRARLAEAVAERYGAVNALVNNAGRAPRVRADILEASEESFEELMRINLQGPYFLTQALARQMAARRQADPSFTASIVFVTSVSAEMASTARGEYCVSKAGLAMAARLYAVRLAPLGIPVFEVRPGIIATDMTAGVRETYDARIANGLVPERRWGQPEDVGRAVAALLRGDIPYATGTVLHVDGGLTLPTL